MTSRPLPRLRLLGLVLLPAALAAFAAWLWIPDGARGTTDKVEKDEPVSAPAPLPERNGVNTTDKGIPIDFSGKKGKEKNIKWQAKLGSNAYGAPVVAGDRVFIGTNNDKPRDPAVKGDKGILMCFRASDGKFLWQAVHNKLPDKLNDYPDNGITSTPVVEGDRLYYVSNRCEIICADVAGDLKAPGKAKILWTYDMIKELEVYPDQAANSSPLIIGDLVFVVTSNGVDDEEFTLPSPKAPSFVAVNKKTGKLAWKSSLPGEKILEGQWSSPTGAKVNGKWQVLFPGGDGWLYGFEAETGKLLWKFDCNPKKSKFMPDGRGDRNYLLAMPVVSDNKAYIGVGRNPDRGKGVGHLWCIDLTKQPKNKDKDVSPVDDNFDPKDPKNKDSALVWHYGGMVMPKPAERDRDIRFGRTLSNVAIYEGLVYAAELDGYLHCLDAKTGQKYWEYDFKEAIWASPYYVDGKVFLGTESGDLHIFAHGKTMKHLAKIDMNYGIQTAPVAVKGVLYLATRGTLFAIGK